MFEIRVFKFICEKCVERIDKYNAKCVVEVNTNADSNLAGVASPKGCPYNLIPNWKEVKNVKF